MKFIKEMARIHGIRLTLSRTTGPDAARISIVLAEEFLKYFSGKVESSRLCILTYFLESDLCRLLREERFTITPLDREDIHDRRDGFNPLKIDNAEGFPSDLARDLILILKEATHNAKNREHQTNLPGEPTSHLLQDQQERFAGLGG